MDIGDEDALLRNSATNIRRLSAWAAHTAEKWQHPLVSCAWCGDCRGDLAAGSWAEVKQGIARAKELCSAGGDWERKNRLKVIPLSLS